MTSKLIDKLTKFCFHSASPTTPASHTHNTSKPHPQHQQTTPTTPANHTHNTSKSNPQPLSASPPTPLRMERGVITEIDLSLGITKPNAIGFTAKFYLYFTPSLYLSLCHSVSKKTLCHYSSLCYSVSKKHSIITRHYVTLSLKTLCHYMSLCHFVSKKTLSLLVPMLFCL